MDKIDFRTTNLQLAIFLRSKGEQIQGIYPISYSKKEIVFVRSDRLEELVEKYKFGNRDDKDLLVEVHAVENARNEILDLLNG